MCWIKTAIAFLCYTNVINRHIHCWCTRFYKKRLTFSCKCRIHCASSSSLIVDVSQLLIYPSNCCNVAIMNGARHIVAADWNCSVGEEDKNCTYIMIAGPAIVETVLFIIVARALYHQFKTICTPDVFQRGMSSLNTILVLLNFILIGSHNSGFIHPLKNSDKNVSSKCQIIR